MNDKPLVNRVAQSSLITLNLEEFFPEQEVLAFDLKPYLFKELILKEKDFRQALKAHDWSQYQDKILLCFCSSDAIIPVWAYMLVCAHANAFATDVFQGNETDFYKAHYKQVIATIEPTQYKDKRIVIKGCSNKPVPPAAYVELTKKLNTAGAQSIMYGEACSTVPIFKRPRQLKK